MGAATGIAELKKPNRKSTSLSLEGNTGFSCMTMLSASRKLKTDTVKAVGKSPISTISVGTREQQQREGKNGLHLISASVLPQTGRWS